MSGTNGDLTTLPQDPAAERALAAAMLRGGRPALQAVAQELGDDGHRMLLGERWSACWRALFSLDAQGLEIEPQALRAELERLGLSRRQADATVREALEAAVLQWQTTLASRTRLVRDAAFRRGVVRLGHELAKRAADAKVPIDELVATLLERAPAVAAAAGPPQARRQAIVTEAADVTPTTVRWLWRGVLPLGRVTLLVGRPGEGKSFASLDWASRVSTGTPWPDGTPCPRGDVLVVQGEDDLADTVVPRLQSHRADLTRVHLLSSVIERTPGGEVEAPYLLTDSQALSGVLTKYPETKLVIVDPVNSFVDARTDIHRDNETRAALLPIVKLAAEYGPAVVLVAHRRKAAGSHADDLALGSRAFTGVARVVWHLQRDAEDKARRLLLPGKNNLSAEGGGFAFTISGDPPAVAWERDRVAMNADEALEAERDAERPGPEPAARNAAADWLRTLLSAGPTEASSIRQEAKAAGLNYRTVQRAADELNVTRTKKSFGSGWLWTLPAEGDTKTTDHATSF